MVGLQVLVLAIEVRILVPEQIILIYITKSIWQKELRELARDEKLILTRQLSVWKSNA